MPESKTISTRGNISLRVPSYQEIMEKLRIKKAVRPYKQIKWEGFFKRSLVIIALVMIVLVVGIFLTLVVESVPSLKALGIKYLWGKTWNPYKCLRRLSIFTRHIVNFFSCIDYFYSVFICDCYLFG